MPDDTEGFARRQAARRRRANADAALSILFQAASAALLLWLRGRYFPRGGLPRGALLLLAVLDAALIVPILAVRRQRLNEIAGGEEDEARHY